MASWGCSSKSLAKTDSASHKKLISQSLRAPYIILWIFRGTLTLRVMTLYWLCSAYLKRINLRLLNTTLGMISSWLPNTLVTKLPWLLIQSIHYILKKTFRLKKKKRQYQKLMMKNPGMIDLIHFRPWSLVSLIISSIKQMMKKMPIVRLSRKRLMNQKLSKRSTTMFEELFLLDSSFQRRSFMGYRSGRIHLCWKRLEWILMNSLRPHTTHTQSMTKHLYMVRFHI